MKKTLFLLMCLALTFSLVACNNGLKDTGNADLNEDDFDLNTITVNSAYSKAQKLGYEGSLEDFVTLISGKDGLGIHDVIINGNGNLVITLSNGETIDCGKVVGKDGKDGADGKDGVTPTIEISTDGYWIINGVKTEYKAIGTDGANGADGKDGVTPTIEISADGYWIINGVNTGYNATYDATPICQHRDADDNNYCDKCEKPYVDGTDIPLVPEHTHRFGEWKPYQNDTYYCENALYFRVCSGCNVIEWKDGSEADHSYVTVVTAPTCHSIGYTTKTCSICGKRVVYNETPVVSHSYSTYSSDNSYHWKKCQYCDMRIEYAEHDLGEDGICNICNNVIGDTVGVIYDISADGTYAEVVGYAGTAKKVKIASEYKGLPVTNIYKNSFYDNDNITTLIIPDSVTTIGSSAFYDCDALTSIVIGDGVTTIGYSAFYDCDYLTSITMGSGVTAIGTDAFYGIYRSKSVYVSDIAAWCNISFETASSNPMYYGTTSYSGYLYLNGEPITDLVIPDGVTTINSYTFYNCRNITGVTVPGSVTSIGDYAFYYCTALSNVAIGNGVTSIGSSAFSDCNSNLYTEYEYGTYVGDANDPYQVLVSVVSKNLRTYIIHENTKCIAPYVFANCERLETITIPNAVTGIDYRAFYNCSGLTSIVIPDSVISIGNSAFYNCDGLASVIIGNSVTSIGDDAFEDCDRLTSVTIPDSVTSIGNHAFRNCYGLTSILIPDSVISIGSSAFSSCYRLTSVTIPDSVEFIGDYAFSSCYGLTSIVIPDSVTTIGDYAFYDCYNLKNIYYTGSEEEWKTISIGSDNWHLTNATKHYNYVTEEE